MGRNLRDEEWSIRIVLLATSYHGTYGRIKRTCQENRAHEILRFSVFRPNLRPQRLILQAQPLLLLGLLRAFRLRRRAGGLWFAAQFPRVEFRDQVAERAERVVVVILGNLGAAAAGVGAVAVEFGFAEQA